MNPLKGKPRYIPQLRIDKQQSLDQITHKNKLTVFDYAVLLSTMYGIGSGIGIVAGTAKGVLPDMKTRPALYVACVSLLILGTTRGFITATKSQQIKQLLEQINKGQNK
jgi:hypothetical protein